ncbi:hypothetical protein HC766_04260, partial [Candidatus Gracilibacteria bacterium]|nr:hypothetical protein [Candidatus Gracilibacteria bacterium]
MFIEVLCKPARFFNKSQTHNRKSEIHSMIPTKNILLFEPDSSGHHPGYLYHLIINFLENEYAFNLVVLVAPDFFEKHPQIIQKTLSPRVKWLKFSDSEFSDW